MAKWRDVVGYEEYLMVSDEGEIYRKDRIINYSDHTRLRKGKIAPLADDKDGYKVFGISLQGKTKSFRVHRLVAEAFCQGKSDERDSVNHINGVKYDNRIVNLEWMTSKENTLHALNNNLLRHPPKKISNCKRCGSEFKINRSNQKYCSHLCGANSANRHRKIKNPPNKLELWEMLKLSSMMEIANNYNVTYGSVQGWCKRNNLPSTQKEIKSILENTEIKESN